MTHTIGRSWRQVVSCGCAGRIVAQERIKHKKHKKNTKNDGKRPIHHTKI